MGASPFLAVLKSVLPTQRGDVFFEVVSREENCCDVETTQYLWNIQQLCVMRNVDQSAGLEAVVVGVVVVVCIFNFNWNFEGPSRQPRSAFK